MDRADEFAVARPAGRLWQLEQRLRALFPFWAKKGNWELLFKALVDDPDFEYLIIDSTIVRAHQHAAGAKGGPKIKPSDVRAAA